MCGYFCIGFTDFMLVVKAFVDFKSMFSPYDLKKKTRVENCFKDE